MLELVAAFICLTTLLTYVNFRFIGLPPTIGVMVTALMFSLLLQGLSFIGYPGLEERGQQLIGQIDFGDLLMNWMLSFLLFAAPCTSTSTTCAATAGRSACWQRSAC